jgi:phosphoribosyl-AMP cyclohydrolase
MVQKPLVYGAEFGELAGRSVELAPELKIIDSADLNGDGIADALVHNASGDEVSVWMMGANGSVSRTVSLQGADGKVLKTGNTDWRVLGLVDADQDNILDIAWHNPVSDEVAFWYMSSGGIRVRDYDYLRDAKGEVFKTGNSSWQVQAIVDFDGDGDGDLLFRLPELNQTAVVHLNKNKFVDAQFIDSPVQADMKIRSVTPKVGELMATVYWENADRTTTLRQTVSDQNGQAKSNGFIPVSALV